MVEGHGREQACGRIAPIQQAVRDNVAEHSASVVPLPGGNIDVFLFLHILEPILRELHTDVRHVSGPPETDWFR